MNLATFDKHLSARVARVSFLLPQSAMEKAGRGEETQHIHIEGGLTLGKKGGRDSRRCQLVPLEGT